MKPSKKMLKQYKQQPREMTPKQIAKLKEQATNHALDVIVGFSMMALRDEYEWGQKRLMRFHKRFMQLNEAYNEGYINMQDIWSTLENETGIKFNEEAPNEKHS